MGPGRADHEARRRGERLVSELVAAVRGRYPDPPVAGLALVGAFVEVNTVVGRSVKPPSEQAQASEPYRFGQQLGNALVGLVLRTSDAPATRRAVLGATRERLDVATRLLRDESPWPTHAPGSPPFAVN